jgi:hypothetical protein
MDARVRRRACCLCLRAEELKDLAFQCELMDDPVVAADGHTYNRFDIENWFVAVFDYGDSRVQVFRLSDGAHLRSFGSAGSGNGQFQSGRWSFSSRSMQRATLSSAIRATTAFKF